MKITTRFFHMLLAVTLLFSSFHHVYAQDATTTATPTTTNTTTTNTTDAATVQHMIDDYNKRLTSIQQLTDQQDQLQGQLATMNRQIYEYDQMANELQPEIDQVNAKMASLQTSIDQTNRSIEARNGLVKSRLVNIYTSESTTVSIMEVLLGSADFGDFINRISMLTMIFKQDKQVIDTMTDDKAHLNSLKDELNEQQKALLAKQAALAQSKADQQKLVDERVQLMSQLQQQKVSEEDQSQKDAEDLAAVDAQLAPDVAAQLQAVLQRKIASDGSWAWPVPTSHVVTSDYGPRGSEFHAGIDIGAPLGTPITAVDSGIVLYAGKANGFGNWVVIKHANGLMSVYGHMYGDGIFVKVGQEVQKGQEIAVVGSDGESTGPHLHFGVATGITGNKMDYIDPRPYLNNQRL
ncbi:murein hydrolase activator EnvC family protein [Paenibacillus aestuarii]|uniref:Murein hydrolase activator EnvC family protein n=1 Tax=Paenibacillus aestuarii TaxID=516965 RepID=A0ABW0K6A1_9BACL|nr:M23 family metallopeptidase [Paenibacillus aestuarii]